MNHSQLDAIYVGRASNRLRDAVQECMTPSGFNAARYRSRVDQLAWDIVHETFEMIILHETFTSFLDTKQNPDPPICGEA